MLNDDVQSNCVFFHLFAFLLFLLLFNISDINPIIRLVCPLNLEISNILIQYTRKKVLIIIFGFFLFFPLENQIIDDDDYQDVHVLWKKMDKLIHSMMIGGGGSCGGGVYLSMIFFLKKRNKSTYRMVKSFSLAILITGLFFIH